MRTRMVGRDGDLAQLSSGLEGALVGRGSLWLVSGEAGIGKTLLLEELAERAAARAVSCFWGRCWEGGGAPSFWPWIQVLRSVLEGSPTLASRAASGPRAPLLASLVPEHITGVEPSARSASEQERFRLYDAVTTVLSDAAKDGPCLFLFEDLHVADAASISLLDFFARHIDIAPILLVATYREQDAARSSIGEALAKVGRRGHRLPLARLHEAEVGTMLPGRDANTVRRVFEASEGNPLFVVEVTRVLTRSPDSSPLLLTEGIRSVIREHLATVGEATVACLEEASILGRDVDTAAVAALGQRTIDDVDEQLCLAAEAGLMTAVGPANFRFSHFLIREVLHAGLSPERRAWLHRAAAERLLQGGPPTPWAELLMHYQNAGPSAQHQAQQAARHAGDQAMGQLAMADAVNFYGQALSMLPAQGGSDSESVRVELLLARAHGQLIIGEHEEAKTSCVAAADIARLIGRPDLFARAALELGGIFIIGNTDGTMVRLLEEALLLLDDGPSALRAQVMARLAAALQPAPDLGMPVAMATEAIAMARTLDDRRALLFTIRSGVSAMMDISDPALRRPLNEEHIRLATELDDRVEMLRGHQRLTLDTLELGDMAAHRASARAADRIANALDHPYYGWRTALLLASEAVASGRFAEAADHDARGTRSAEAANDPAAELTLALHGVGVALVREDDDWIRAGLDRLVDAFRHVQLDSAFGHLVVAGALARMEDATDRRAFVVERDLQVALQFRDMGSLMMVAEVACLQRDGALAERIADAVSVAPQKLVNWGLVGVTCDGPAARARALIACARGDLEGARRAFLEALEIAEAAGLAPIRARILYDLARTTGEVSHAAQARKAATSLGMPGLLKRIEARFGSTEGSPPSAETERTPGDEPKAADDRAELPDPSGSAEQPPAFAPRLTMRAEAGVWVVDTGRGTFHLKRTKGADMLAILLEAPGVEHHVLDLVGGGRQSRVDSGDAGPALDLDARAAYRERLKAIEDALAEAESWSDTGRAERLRSERDALAAELSRAFGLGGRARGSSSASERARVNVQRRLKDTIKRIAAYDPDTGKWLERSVVTGTYCRFDPLGL